MRSSKVFPEKWSKDAAHEKTVPCCFVDIGRTVGQRNTRGSPLAQRGINPRHRGIAYISGSKFKKSNPALSVWINSAEHLQPSGWSAGRQRRFSAASWYLPPMAARSSRIATTQESCPVRMVRPKPLSRFFSFGDDFWRLGIIAQIWVLPALVVARPGRESGTAALR